MANNLELITGKYGTPHISSMDVRAFNRSIFGAESLYVLNDGDGCKITASASSSGLTVNISEGSMLWNGMHIRNKATTTVTTTSIIGSAAVAQLDLIYVQANTIEGVQFVLRAGSPSTNYKFSDSTIDAECTIATIRFSTTSSTVTSITDRRTELSNVSSLVSAVHSDLANNNAVVQLFQGSAGVGDTMTLSEAFTNFNKLLFVGSSSLIGEVLVSGNMYPASMIANMLKVGQDCDFQMNGVSAFTDTGDLYSRINRARLYPESFTSIRIKKGSYSYFYAGMTTGDFLPITKIFGVGRVN